MKKNEQFKYCNNYVSTAKYTVFTFIPKNLYEQFRRLANIYFLVIAGLQQIDGLSPTGKYTTLIPLLLVISVSALKEAIEDFARHREDKRVNNRIVDVLKNGKWEPTPWHELLTGEIVRIKSGSYLPADVVLLTSSEPQGIAYIETAQLDGETNLKIRQAPGETVDWQSEKQLMKMNAVINSEQPNKRLYNFDASLKIKGVDEEIPLAPKQLLLRGSMLRNTEWAIGSTVFCGRDTKLVRNSSRPPLKRSNVERTANKQILWLFALELLLAIVCAIGSSVWQGQNGDSAWYLSFKASDDSPALAGFYAFLTFVILYNTIVPISLYVSMEMCKLGQAYFINQDLQMYYEKNDTPALARTSNLNEELGQVEYIFSDKTGTLTRNQMQFRQCTIGSKAYGDMSDGYTGPKFVDSDENEAALADPLVQFEDKRVQKLLAKGDKTAVEFVTLLAICHTVIPETKPDGTKTYEASSPDEAALVAAARALGYQFTDRTLKTVTFATPKGDRQYQLLNVLEFNSTRKRMSIIVKSPEGEIILYCKGADSVIFERLTEKERKNNKTTLKHLEAFAETGLRTLCCAKSVLNEKEYSKWNKKFHKASVALQDRQKLLDEAAAEIETDLQLLGTTAIEDKLQVGVPDTIATLAKAGIKIWVLTGDKQETAINIAYSCKLFTKDMMVSVLNEHKLEGCKKRIKKLSKEHPEVDENFALVVDGATLEHALSSELSLEFLELGRKCKAVVACRVSPAQKAEVVKLVRDNVGAISLAIGDGANDVSMIQAAHVGVGISGEEGLQAARSSDYAIAQFRFLLPLLLVHGRHAYRRVAKLINYSFYKNIVLVMTQFWFTLYNGFSGQSFYEQWTLASYNAIFTALPVIFYGMFDRDVSDSMSLRYPQLYMVGHRQYYYSLPVFLGWMANGLFHSIILFMLPVFAGAYESTSIAPNGRSLGIYETGIIVYTSVIIVVTMKLALESSYWNWINHLVIWGSLFVLFFLFQLLYSLFGVVGITFMGYDITYSFYMVGSTATYWLCIIMVPLAALSHDLTWKYIKRTYMPEFYHIVQEIERLENQARKKDGVYVSMYQDDVEDDSKPALVHEETETRLKEMDKKVTTHYSDKPKRKKRTKSSGIEGDDKHDNNDDDDNDDNDDKDHQVPGAHKHHGFAFAQSRGSARGVAAHDMEGEARVEALDIYVDMSTPRPASDSASEDFEKDIGDDH